VTPVRDLLNRIRWDAEFSAGKFDIGYFDRVEGRIIRVSMSEVSFPEHDHAAFEFIDSDGVSHHVPLHRVREVFKNGVLIWQRKVGEG